MFYTKYRPQKFSEISSPNETAEALMMQVKNSKIAHAYLFVGSRGTGKTTTARILAKAVNCLNIQKNGDPCNECANCLSIQQGRFTDLIEIDAASNRGIDDIRELKDKIKLAPSVGTKKVYIIDEVHMLTTEAFNALLKTLEEPPTHTMFILCTTEIHKVPDTIKSRCQVFKFKRASVTQLVEKLESIAKKEKATVSKEDLVKVAQASLGGFRDAETLLQQIVEGNITPDSLAAANSRENLSQFMLSLSNNDAKSALKQVNNVLDEGIDIYVWVGELLKYLRDLLLIKSNAHEGLVDSTDEGLKLMQKQASEFTSSSIVVQIEKFIKAQNLIKNAFIPQLPVEMAIVELCKDGLEDDVQVIDEPIKPKDKLDPPKQPPKVEVKSESKPVVLEIKKPVKKSTNIEFKKIEEGWGDILNKVVAVNNSVMALLKGCKALELEGNIIVLEVFYAFHKERLEHPKNRKIIEDALSEVFNEDLTIKCIVSENRPAKTSPKEVGELTDYNVTIPSSSSGTVLDIFDGGLPLKS